MAGQTLTEAVELKREGELRPATGVGSDIYPWFLHRDKTIIHDTNNAIATAARDMGYEPGDIVRYRIIIEPKRG